MANYTSKEIDNVIRDNIGRAKEIIREAENSTSQIAQARERLANDLAFHMKQVDTLEGLYAKASNQLKNLAPTDANYQEQVDQVAELKKNADGARIARDGFIKKLQEANQQSVIDSAQANATTALIDQRIREKEEEARKIEKAIADIQNERKDKRDNGTWTEELENNYKAQMEENQDKLNKIAEELPNALNAELGENTFVSKAGVAGVLNSLGKTGNPFFDALSGARRDDAVGDMTRRFGEQLASKVGGPVGIAISGVTKVAGKILDVCLAMRKSVDKWVDEAAQVLSANVGKINAALEGTGKTFQDSSDAMVSSLGLNRFVKQQDYIGKIAELTAQGLNFNVEQRAILETIRDKTVKSFSSMDGNLVRLIRLKQQDITQAQFGLEAALRNTLNRIFKDTQYLDQMYDSIASAITDSVIVSGGKDVNQYSSVVQTWMGAMYASGIDSGTVSKFANAINNLGSGNVTALAGDQEIQRLMLLSMDTIGMDYADILQQGLTTSDINDLLGAVVEYLSKIESNTKDNNVLTASYTNLFGMSRADLQGFKNLRGKMGRLAAVDTGGALAVAQQEIAKFQSTERTIAAEQIDNVINNAKFTFGKEIAESTTSYLTWKASNLILDAANSIVEAAGGSDSLAGKVAGKVVAPFRIAATMGVLFNEGKGLLGLLQALPSLFTSGESAGGINAILNAAPTSGGDTTSYGADLVTTGASGQYKTVNMNSLRSSSTYTGAQVVNISDSDWKEAAEEEDEVLTELKEITKTLVKAEADAKHYAIATYLVGMTDDTLRSFASIFADEDAMNETFTGKNEVLKDNLFKYMDDTTSNSKKTNGKTNSKTNSKTTTNSGNVSTI